MGRAEENTGGIRRLDTKRNLGSWATDRGQIP